MFRMGVSSHRPAPGSVSLRGRTSSPSTREMIVLLESVHPDALALLERADQVRVMANPIELDADLPLDEVRAVLTRGRGRITAEMYRRLPNLQVVGRCGAGLDNIDTVAAKSVGYRRRTRSRAHHACGQRARVAADAGTRPSGDGARQCRQAGCVGYPRGIRGCSSFAANDSASSVSAPSEGGLPRSAPRSA